jgi:2-oxoglutarate dehydrogenase E2 component (dihydrolipoamide succinyltransferase)
MNRMRLRIAERLKQSQNTAASLTTFNEVDMSSLMEFRKLYKDDVLKKTGVKLGFMSAFSRASVLAMRDIPVVNASIEGPNGGDTIVYRDYVDISVAVATEKGLVTPVVRNTEAMDLISIEKSIAELGKKVGLEDTHSLVHTDQKSRPVTASSQLRIWLAELSLSATVECSAH